ncbi:MAG: ferritin-like domain-containing protein [Oscillospiraceae bacterium]|nr:ferritin-like domain-containing protein [Oscillospiraceae bacterium]
METFDKAKAARVWQRVQGDVATNPTRGLQGLIAEEWTDAAIYLSLSKRVQGNAAAILRKIGQEEQAHMACLKGIYTLQGTGRPDIPAPSPIDRAPVSVMLRRCYGREMRCLAQYEARANDPEYGQIFTRMAQQEREHCRLILELLGSLPADK